MPQHEDHESRDRARRALAAQIGYLEDLAANPSASNAERLEALRLLADVVRLLDKKPHPKGPPHHDERDDEHDDDEHDPPRKHGAKKHAPKKHAAKKHAAKKHAAKKHGRHAGELPRGREAGNEPRRLGGSEHRGLLSGGHPKRLGP